MIAAVTDQGKARWMVIDDAFNAGKLVEFLDALVKDTDKKVSLILDNLRVHHSKPGKAWLAERTDKTEVFCLPSYSPEPNPEERPNAGLKQAIGKRVPVRTKAKLRAAANQHYIRCWGRTPTRTPLLSGQGSQVCGLKLLKAGSNKGQATGYLPGRRNQPLCRLSQ